MHGTTSLTVETHNFSERLGNTHLETSRKEVSEALTILIEVASDETLISSIEEWIKAVGLANVGDSLPLLHSGINTGGVVSASMKENDGSRSSVLEILNHTIEVETLGLFVEISVRSNL